MKVHTETELACLERATLVARIIYLERILRHQLDLRFVNRDFEIELGLLELER